MLCPGNHDLSVLFLDKKENDIIYSIIYEQKLKNTLYLNKSGFYHISNNITIAFVHPSEDCRGKYLRFLNKNQCKEPREKICGLYHGIVQPNNPEKYFFKNTRSYYNVGDFEDFFFTFLGDIHKALFLNNSNTIGYASSFSQMNFGENEYNHGCIVWDILNRTTTRKYFLNPYLFKNIYISDKGFFKPEFRNYIKYVHIRYVYNTDATSLKRNIVQLKVREYIESLNIKILSETFIVNYNVFKKKVIEKDEILPFEIESDVLSEKDDDLILIDNPNFLKNSFGVDSNISVDDLIQNYSYEEHLRFYLEHNNMNLTNEKIQKVLNIYLKEKERIINLKKKNDDVENEENDENIFVQLPRHSWEIETFQFSNLLTYGYYNYIDFTQCKNLSSITAPNTFGKSAIFDGICYTLYGESKRCGNNLNLLRKKQDKGYFELIILVNKRDRYKFVRMTHYHLSLDKEEDDANKKNRLDLNSGLKLYEMKYGETQWTQIMKKGEQLKDFIKNLIGLYSSFLDQSIFFQNKIESIMNSSQKDSYKVFLKLFNLGQYLILSDKRKDGEYNKNILENKKNDFAKKISFLNKPKNLELFNKNEQNILELLNEKDILNNNIIEYKTNIEFLAKKLEINEDKLNDILSNEKKSIYNEENILLKRDLNNKIKYEKNILQLINDKINLNLNEIKKIELKQKNYQQNLIQKKEFDERIDSLKYNFIDSLQNKITQKLKIEEILIFNEEINKFIKNIMDIFDKDNNINENELIEFLKNINENKEINKKLLVEKNEHEYILNNFNEELKKIEETLLKENINTDYLNSSEEIMILKDKIKNDKIMLKKMSEELVEKKIKVEKIIGEVNLLKNKNEQINNILKEVEKIENEQKEFLDTITYIDIFYNSIDKKKGFLSLRLNKYVSILERLMNQNLEYFGKYYFKITVKENIIMKISKTDKDDEKSYYPITNSSGFETFLMSILLKAIIKEMSIAPQFSFIFLDETLQNMDSENIIKFNENMHHFNMYFEKIFIISHNSEILENIDNHIYIKKNENGISEVKFGHKPCMINHKEYLKIKDNDTDEIVKNEEIIEPSSKKKEPVKRKNLKKKEEDIITLNLNISTENKSFDQIVKENKEDKEAKPKIKNVRKKKGLETFEEKSK